jgi:hypothetical protein
MPGCLGFLGSFFADLFVLLLLAKFTVDAWGAGVVPQPLLQTVAVIFAVFLGLGEGDVVKWVRGAIGFLGLLVFLTAAQQLMRGIFLSTAGTLILAYAFGRFLYGRFAPVQPWRWTFLHWFVVVLLAYFFFFLVVTLRR